MQKQYFSSCILISVLCFSLLAETKPAKRKPFSIPLPRMTCSFDSGGKCVAVFVVHDGSQEGWEIASGNDRYIKDTKKIRMDHIYRELPSQTSFISAFEAGVLADLCNRMAETVLILEKDLKQQHWDRCLFLDAYFPNFMEHFYHLFNAAVENSDELSPVTLINDTLYDNSENSLKSDQRINVWKSDTSYTMKLRIASRELAYQLDLWRTKVLLDPERDLWDNKTEQLVSIYDLFVRLYFNLPQK